MHRNNKMKTNSQRTGVSTFAGRTSQHTTKVFNRACKAGPKEIRSIHEHQ